MHLCIFPKLIKFIKYKNILNHLKHYILFKKCYQILLNFYKSTEYIYYSFFLSVAINFSINIFTFLFTKVWKLCDGFTEYPFVISISPPSFSFGFSFEPLRHLAFEHARLVGISN